MPADSNKLTVNSNDSSRFENFQKVLLIHSAKNVAGATLLLGLWAYVITMFAGHLFTPIPSWFFAFNLTFLLYFATVGGYRIFSFVFLTYLHLYTEHMLYACKFAQLDRVYRNLFLLPGPMKVKGLVRTSATVNSAIVRISMGESERAEIMLDQAITDLQGSVGSSLKRYRDIYLVWAYCAMTSVSLEQRKFIEAELHLDKVFEHLEKNRLPQTGVNHAWAHWALGTVYSELNDPRAEENFLKAKKLLDESVPSPFAPRHKFLYMRTIFDLSMASFYAKQDKMTESLVYLDQFWQDLEKKHCPRGAFASQAMNQLVAELIKRKQYERAEKLLELSYSLLVHTPFTISAKEMLICYEDLLSQTGRQSEIGDLKNWLRAMPVLEKLN